MSNAIGEVHHHLINIYSHLGSFIKNYLNKKFPSASFQIFKMSISINPIVHWLFCTKVAFQSKRNVWRLLQVSKNMYCFTSSLHKLIWNQQETVELQLRNAQSDNGFQERIVHRSHVSLSKWQLSNLTVPKFSTLSRKTRSLFLTT